MKKNLVLTGMMGVGKSTIGKKLAKKLKLKFVDMSWISEKILIFSERKIFFSFISFIDKKIKKTLNKADAKTNSMPISLNIFT